MPVTKNMRPAVCVVTLGCSKNLVDSELMLGRLAEAGAVICEQPDHAQVIIVNTCAFIDSAKQQSIDAILELAELKARDPRKILVAAGCLSQRYGKALRKEMPEIDAVVPLRDMRGILRACGLGPGAKWCDAGPRVRLTPRHYAYLRIAEGCDNRCTYCAIPDIRGPFRSRPAGEVTAEAEQLVADGAREINVIAQDTTLYGKDSRAGETLALLLRRLSGVPRLRWIRLLYTHPAHFRDDLIDEIASNSRICPYVDLPVQHLNDRILKRMGRRVTQAQILDLIDRLRARIPGLTLRTSVIIGFPGETDAAFEELLQLVQRIRFERLGAFTYSREEGTPAARYSRQVSERIKRERLDALMTAQQHIAFEQASARIGQTATVLIDEASGHAPDEWRARSRAEAPEVDPVILVGGRRLAAGRFRRVRITGSRGYDLVAKPLARAGA